MTKKASRYSIPILLVIFGMANCQAYHFLSAAALGGIRLAPEFADVSDTMIQQIISLPSLFVVPGAILLPIMTRYISKKKLSLIGAMLQFLTGISPAFTSNMTLILVGRAIGGFCMGFMTPIAMSLIYEEFTDDAKKNVTAWFNMAGPLITGVLLQQLNGFLASQHWRYVFFSYGVFLVVFLLNLFFMEDKGVERAEVTGGPTFVLSGLVILFGALSGINQLLTRVHVNNLSMVVTLEGTGNQVIVGTSMSMMTLGSVVMGFFFAALSKKLKGATRSLATLLMGLGLLTVFYGYNTNIAPVVGAFILGSGVVLNMSANMLSLSAHVPATALTGAMVTYHLFYNVGQYISPVIINNLAPIFVGETIRGRFLFGGVVCIILAVIYAAIKNLDKKTYEKEEEVAQSSA
ncbi:MAG: MFS transporter [Tissierellia bacterium]|nr:MFS transporter [Tissierellia bacterium]